MEKKKGMQIMVIAVLAFAILFMSVGFAAYGQNLAINGTATVKANKWSVHFDTESYAQTTGSVTPTTKTIDNLSVNYNITLEKPGNYYEFTIDVVNDGTFDAVLNSITMSTLSEAQKKYLKYEVTYDNSKYTETDTTLNADLVVNATKTVKVRVEYVQPAESTDLPSTDAVNLSLTAALAYNQKA